MKKFILTNDDFSSIEVINGDYTVDDIYHDDNYLAITVRTLLIPPPSILTENELKSIFCNKNRFIIIDDEDISYCFESKYKFYYNDNIPRLTRFEYTFLLRDIKVTEMDKGLVNMLNFTLC